MKALIFNSGLGSRLGALTKEKPKCMLELYNGETILERQIRILSQCGINEFIITTGPFEEQLHKIADKFKEINFSFIKNDNYVNTNYIVSMYNAREYLDCDILMLHGDLVFNKNLILKLVKNPNSSVCLFNENKELPNKDFKGRFKDNKLLEVSIDIFDNECYAFQPLYKLSKADVSIWKDSVVRFIQEGNTKVYAENALNKVLDTISIQGMSYRDDFIEEIDNEEDYQYVNKEIKFFDYREQNIIFSENYIKTLKNILNLNDRAFIVCSKRIAAEIQKQFSDFEYSVFTDFTPNPKYDDIKRGVKLFNSEKHNIIVSIGGGSTIDVAKCIKLLAVLDNEDDFLSNKFKYSNIRHIAIPTTAGSGSESTQFAVIYSNNRKKSIEHACILPDCVILSPVVLKTLSDYQRKSCLLDAFCQAIESFWAKHATKESQEYSRRCIKLILSNYENYLGGDINSYKNIMMASNYSGKAINISKTTSAHAMSYMLSQKYKINHGHAVALCLIPIWELLIQKSYNDNYLRCLLSELSTVFNVVSLSDAKKIFENIVAEMNFNKIKISHNDLILLTKTVNPDRMNNNPVCFTDDEIYNLYKKISERKDILCL